MPAAAVIPAPIAYIKVVVVKKLVVGSQIRSCGPPPGGYCSDRTFGRLPLMLFAECLGCPARLL